MHEEKVSVSPTTTMPPTHPDIILFLSDQHNASVAGYAGDSLIRTPVLDQLAGTGCRFTDTYTPCPLCVPARVAFLSGQLPSQTVAFTNASSVPGDHATWLHGLASIGYETVLCGRMHFVGEDQRHGFTQRIFPDFTPQYWQTGKKFNQDLGDYAGTLDANRTTLKAKGGGGHSPVLAYDKAVVDAAVEYLATPRTRPLCLVVGTYGPHNPYVCGLKQYHHYRPQISLPERFGAEAPPDTPLTRQRRIALSEGEVLSLRAAYYGMVETLDEHVGRVQQAWETYADKTGHEGWFIYTSDHGDHAGERNTVGKQTLFEASVRIPLLISGKNIPAGQCVSSTVSLLDLGPTINALCGAPVPPNQAGQNLLPRIQSHTEATGPRILSETMDEHPESHQPVLCRMIKEGDYKLITHDGHAELDLLFNLKTDPGEAFNLAQKENARYQHMYDFAWANTNPQRIISSYLEKKAHTRILCAYGDRLGPPEDEVWTAERGHYRLPECDLI
jgi:choline-sulfatase